MRDVTRIIDRIIKADPSSETDLVSLRRKFRRYPHKKEAYWKELVDYLGSKYAQGHPKRDEIRKILIGTPKKVIKKNYTFEEVSPKDCIVGLIPENISDKIKAYDRKSIELAKKQVEANLTRNTELIIEVSRKGYLLEIYLKKIWVEVKDHFGLWDKPEGFVIKKKDSLLYLAVLPQEVVQRKPMSFIGGDPRAIMDFLKKLGFSGGNDEEDAQEGDSDL